MLLVEMTNGITFPERVFVFLMVRGSEEQIQLLASGSHAKIGKSHSLTQFQTRKDLNRFFRKECIA